MPKVICSLTVYECAKTCSYLSLWTFPGLTDSLDQLLNFASHKLAGFDCIWGGGVYATGHLVTAKLWHGYFFLLVLNLKLIFKNVSVLSLRIELSMGEIYLDLETSANIPLPQTRLT